MSILKRQDLLRLQFALNKRRYKIDLIAELRINDNNLNTEIEQQPAKFAWFAVLYNHAVSTYDKLYEYKKEVYAKLDKRVRQRLEDRGQRVTDKKVDAIIRRSTAYKKITNRVLDARHDMNILQYVVESFRQRKDMLQSLSVNIREEKLRKYKQS